MDLGQVFTNKSVALYMASLFDLDSSASILDPCFGSGAFLQASIEQGYSNIEGYEIDKDLFAETKNKFSSLKLHNRDFLSTSSKKKYDGIIMNPPYIRQEKIDSLKEIGITKEKLRKIDIFSELPSTANMYMYFIFKAIDLLKKDGELIVIFPSSWIDARSGKQFQKALYSLCTLKQQVHISGEVFEKNALVEVVILKLQRGKSKSCEKITFLEMRNSKLYKLTKDNYSEKLPLTVLFQNYASIRRGLTTGCNSMYINPNIDGKDLNNYFIPILSTPKAINGYSTKSARTDKILYPIVKSEMPQEIKKYIDYWEKKILDEKSPKTLHEKIKKGQQWYIIKQLDSQGILFSYFVRNDMKFVLNNNGYLARDNFYIIKPKIDEYLLFALLNNYFTYYQLEQFGKKYGAGLLKLQRYDIENLKFPNVNIFSEFDINRLREMALSLEKTGNKNIVTEITKIIAKYTDWRYEKIMKKYESIKKDRLEAKNRGIKRS